MKPLFLNSIREFLGYYRQYHERILTSPVRYRIASTLEEYKVNNVIELAFTDKPGDLLPPLDIKKIKNMPDIISGMHPVDVNSINDIYYLNCDHIKEIKVSEDTIVAIDNRGNESFYKLNDNINPDLLKSTRLSYTIGYMQAERIMRDILKDKPRYKIIRDNITTIYVEDLKTGNIILKQPNDILFSREYMQFTKDDIARIGFICGQMYTLSK